MWFNQWIQAYSQLSQKDYGKAITGFKNLEDMPSLRNEKEILVPLGKAQYFNGEHENALNTLQRANRIDPNSLSVCTSTRMRILH